MQRIISDQAPKAIGPYVHATVSGQLVFVSGQLGVDPKTGQLCAGFDNQARMALTNLKNVLEASGSDVSHVLKTTIFMADMANFTAVNALYADAFADIVPARTAIQIGKLPMDADLEIEAIAELR